MQTMKNDKIRQSVRENYGKIVKPATDNCCEPSSCCGSKDEPTREEISLALGYSSEDMAAIPEGANLGLGCGNPKAIAALKPGETVIDLGSGGGLDCFLASKEVCEKGRVIGVDMTSEMISKARANAEKAGTSNIEFRLGEIEHLPIADCTADVIISNCVINLSPDKQSVYNDAFRVLKPCGRLAISDVVLIKTLPDKIKNDSKLYSACVAGASTISEIEQMLKTAGFDDIKISPKDESKKFIQNWSDDVNLEDFILSAYIEACKPCKTSACCS